MYIICKLALYPWDLAIILCSMVFSYVNYYLQDENEGSLTSHLDTELGKKVYLWNEKFGIIILTFTTMS